MFLPSLRSVRPWMTPLNALAIISLAIMIYTLTLRDRIRLGEEDCVVIETAPRKHPRNQPVPKPEVNITLRYFPAHKAKDYPLSLLPDPYMIRNEDACSNFKDLKFLVIVTSATSNFEYRRTIRQTWGNPKYYKKGEVRVVFMLARSTVDRHNTEIAGEARTHGDIVQGRFLDTYKNLTHKSVLGVRWVHEHCRNAKMVVKVDDDVVLNLFELIHLMKVGECCNDPREIKGHLRPIGDSIIIRDDEEEKWRVDDDYFPNLKTFPFPYCDGLFSLIHPKVIPILVETATYMPVFFIEDVYLTGLLINQAKTVKLTNIDGIWPFEDEGIDCFEKFKAECVMIAGLSSNIKQFRYMWSLILDYY